MDFFQISTKENNRGVVEVFPDFTVVRSKDLMVRARSFYAIWAEEQGLWSTDEYDVQRIVDEALRVHAENLKAKGAQVTVKYLKNFSSNGWTQFRKFMYNISDNSTQLDENLTFADTKVKKNDYASRRLPYSLAPGDHSAWDELVGKLYKPEERAKIEWAIGAVISGDAKKIQKFLVFYGPGGTGKSTIMTIIQKLFQGYTATFEAKALVGNNNAFSTSVFASNPLVAIQHDGDLSKIEDSTKLNSIVSHEDMTINEKHKPTYTARINAFLFMGTNKPVKISDAKSGIIRRLIDVHPTGDKFHPNKYNSLMARIDFELGAIAHHCLEVYREMGKNYYNTYRPVEMMLQTDVFFNFVEAYFDVFKSQDGITLRQAYSFYKEYCKDTNLEYVMPQFRFREELRNYFDDFKERAIVDGVSVRSYYSGFSAQPFKMPLKDDSSSFALVLDETVSKIFDVQFASCPAQYSKEDGSPEKYWTDDERVIAGQLRKPKPHQICSTTLADLDTSREHFVKLPVNHIVIDFDLRDKHGKKSLERNLAAASEWPPTYAELSKSGSGVHLHYNYTGPNVAQLDPVFSEGIEVKVFTGNGSLRRALSRCNSVPIAELNGGLPFKEKKRVLTEQTVKSERGLRELIIRNFGKEFHPSTKSSIDFIKKILDDAYASGMTYDVSDMRPDITAFAACSSHQAIKCLQTVDTMRFMSADREENTPPWPTEDNKKAVAKARDERPVFFDIESYPNLFVICWKYYGDANVVRMINPTSKDVEPLLGYKLIGFYNRQYDNHMLYAAFLGFTVEELYKLSQRLIEGKDDRAKFGEAFNLSYADIHEFSTKKQGLKKWQIELGIHHKEMDLPWDQPVPEDRIADVVEYCVNDVISEEAVFNARKGDWTARQILAELSGLTLNETTPRHTAKIIFGDDRDARREFVYTNLSKMFPGYEYNLGKSTYRGETVGEGGYVDSEPGMYEDVALLDVASMHPTSIVELNLFGRYTANFKKLLDARLAIKHKDYDAARALLGDKLDKYLGSPEDSKALADALKIAINIVYGLTSAKFDNPFRDPRNKDNIVAKRGALFMIDLKHAVKELGFTVAHIKTDSIKIPNATPEVIDFVMNFGAKYGYTFEHETTYDKFCLVNDAVYIARKDECVTPEWKVVDESQDEAVYLSNVDEYDDNAKVNPDGERKITWTAVGAQFQHPYVFKTLFSKEPIVFEDVCEAKSVTQGTMYLDFDTDMPMALAQEPKAMQFVGRTGLFVPVREGHGGGRLWRIKDGKPYAVSGTKGYFWVEAETAKAVNMDPEYIDMTYFENLAEKAREAIDYFGPFADFVR